MAVGSGGYAQPIVEILDQPIRFIVVAHAFVGRDVYT